MHPKAFVQGFSVYKVCMVLGGEALSSQQLELTEIEVLLKE